MKKHVLFSLVFALLLSSLLANTNVMAHHDVMAPASVGGMMEGDGGGNRLIHGWAVRLGLFNDIRFFQ